ncbi:ATP-binding protein [Paenibacillus doosanensis]|uniref:histidine kinase n=1 Tax=Paenibacillus konkukensis TaxID=2020716 RepID=A0ABY4RXN2_9BACL|nr:MULTISPECIES: ATP-binding protein [Paenibacillus]MCS7458958.1 ATP-binding protein [Paenibacillus doosanensis]UQZ86509.1 Alkaline phosphatase synthesis sensor protein PhoR [Paenibacillus konkukensis]
MIRFLRKMNVILFITLQSCFILIISIVAYGYSFNWQNVFDRYQEDQLKVNAFKLIDDIRNENMSVGPYNEDQKSWLTRRATLYGILVRYGEDRRNIWFDMFSRVQNEKDLIVQEYPVVAKGETKGVLQVGYLKTVNQIDPNVVAYQKMMQTRSALLYGIIIVISVIVSFFVARLLSAHLERLQEAAHKIRLGNWEVQASVKGPEEVRRLALTLNELSRELKKQEDWRHHLMEDLTHELRTPLTSMLSQLEAMIDGIYEVDLEWLQQIYDELIRLTRLMNDMEKLSEAEAARFTIHIRRINMVQLTQNVYRNFQQMARSKGVKLQFVPTNAPCYAEVDRDKMIQIISNIVSNAIKYTNEGGKVTLGVDWTTDSTIIYCKDTGIGISEADLPYVFNRLYRVDKSRSRFSGGVGLGLSIVKALVEAHEGEIEVTSELGHGSSFTVTIPNVYKSLEQQLA